MGTLRPQLPASMAEQQHPRDFRNRWRGCKLGERADARVFSDAEALEIRENEIEEYTGSVFEVIHDVMQHREGGFG